MNKWHIPLWLENEVRERDTHCIYCGVKFVTNNKKETATWEHIINDARIITRENIALCCRSCNASKGAKQLSKRLMSDYCKKKNITPARVAPIVKQALRNS